MADISQVTALLAQMAATAVYPSGTTQPSVTTRPITIFEGWPLQQTLDAAITAGQSMVSVFPTRVNGGGAVFQVQDEDYLITQPVHGLTISSIANGAVSVMGTPAAGEYLSIVVDNRHAYSRVGDDLPTILNAIAADATADGYTVSVFAIGGPDLPLWQGATGGGIQFSTDRLQAKIGSPATKGRVTHRQRAGICITVWAPNNADRNTIAIAVDVALKAVNRLTFPDTSQGLLVASGFVQEDKLEPASIYRRDLNFTCEYATLQPYQAFEITSVISTVDAIGVGGGVVQTTYVTG